MINKLQLVSTVFFLSVGMSLIFSADESNRSLTKKVVVGSVMEHEVEFTTGVAAYLNTIGNAEKFGEELLSLYKTTRPSNVVIRISGQGINIETRTDAKGIPDIKLKGYLEHQYDAPGELTKFTAVSDKDGSYVLEGIPLPSVWIIGGWLNGGNPAVSQSPFFLEIRTGDGMGTSMIRHLPLVTANLLEQARRLHEVMNLAYTRLNSKGNPLKDASGLLIPESHGNVIIAPDITLITEVGSNARRHP